METNLDTVEVNSACHFGCAVAEIRRLLDEVHEYRKALDISTGCVEKMESECDELRRDAERYRWLRSQVASLQRMDWLSFKTADELDAAIDSARGKP